MKTKSAAPLVSVIIPSFNHGKYVRDAIASVLEQDYPHLELIVVDDGSTDESHAILREYADVETVKIFLNDENRGQGARLNFGIDQSLGEFICILPSDDWFCPNKVRRQVERFAELPATVGLVYTKGLNYFEADGTYEPSDAPTLRGQVFHYILRHGNFIFPASTMIRRKCFDHIRFNESFIAEGEGAFVRIARYWDVDYVDDFLTVMRTHTYNTGAKTAQQYAEVIRWFETVLNDPSLPKEIKAERRLIIGRLHRMKGLEFLIDAGDRGRARGALLQALRLYPQYILAPTVIFGLLLSLIPGGERAARKLKSWGPQRRYWASH